MDYILLSPFKSNSERTILYHTVGTVLCTLQEPGHRLREPVHQPSQTTLVLQVPSTTTLNNSFDA
jgi:hypothetical protein